MTQARSLAEQLKALEHLQELDLKIDQLKKTKSTLPAALKTLDDSLAKLRATATAKKNAVAEIEKTQRQTRAALDLNRDRLSRSSGKLEGVKNSTEFQAASKEIEQLKKVMVTLEEQSKKSDADLEAGNQEVQKITAEMEKIEADRQTQMTAISGQTGQIDQQLAELTGERAKFTPNVDPRILSQYDRLRGARAGLGFVPAVAGRCKGCNMVVPPQLYNEIRKLQNLHSCPSCHRLLFVPGEGGGSNSAAS